MFGFRFRASGLAIRSRLFYVLGLLLVLLVVGTLTVGATTSSERLSIEADRVIEEDFYGRAETAIVDGTIRGTATIAAKTIAINGSVEDDVYLMAETITINGTVSGDAILTGREVRINGRVEKDADAIAQTLILSGAVGEDLRWAGEALLLEAKAEVGKDVSAAGESVESRVGSRIGRNLNFWGARALLAGTIQQNAIASVGAAALHGIVDGNVNFTVGERQPWQIPFLPEPAFEQQEVPKGLVVTDSAQIGGNFTYRSPEAARLGKKAWIAGSTVREPQTAPQKLQSVAPARTFWQQFQRFIALMVVGGALLQFKPAWIHSLTQTVRDRPLSSLGWGVAGVLAAVGVTLAIGLLASLLAAFFGLTLPSLVLPVLSLGMLANLILLLSFGLFVSFVPQIALSYLGGRILLPNVSPTGTNRSWRSLGAGLAVFVAIAAIPVAGQFFSLTVICLGLGALAICGRQWQQRDAANDEKHSFESVPALAPNLTNTLSE